MPAEFKHYTLIELERQCWRGFGAALARALTRFYRACFSVGLRAGTAAKLLNCLAFWLFDRSIVHNTEPSCRQEKQIRA